MMNMMLMLPLYGLVMVVFGIYTFGIGLWGFIQKRPLVFAARQLMWFCLAMYLPVTIQSFAPLFESSTYTSSFGGDLFWIIMPIIQLAMLALLVFIFWRQMTGYMIFGVSDETFRNALISALTRLNLPFQETISKIKLTGINADLQIAVAAWMGTAQIRIKQREQAHYTKEIARAIDAYYQENVVELNRTAFVIYLLLGILMIGFAIVLVIFGANLF